MKKSDLKLRVQYLNAIIDNVEYDNCYNNIVDFFKLTSYLQDRKSEILTLSLKGWELLSYASRSRKKAEKQRDSFIDTLDRAGRGTKYNKTKSGEEITKEKIFFGNACGVCNGRISKFESSDNSEIQGVVRPQIIRFVRSFKGRFSLDWLR